MWDEFSHWMLVVKNMYHFDNFGVTGASTVLLPGYPPASGLIEIFFNMFSSSFTEGNIYKGFNILMVSLLMPPLKKCGTCFGKTFIRFIVFLSVPLVFYTDAYGNILVDCLLGIMFARLIYIGISEEKYDAFFLYNFSISSAVLVLTKAAGMGLYLFALLILIMDVLFFSKEPALNGVKTRNRWSKLIAWMSVIAVPLIADYSWKSYLKVNKLDSAWNTSNVTFSGVFELFTDRILPYRATTIRNFIDAFFRMNPWGDIGIKCSYFLLPAIFTFAMFAVSSVGGNKKRVRCLNLSLLASYLFYTVSLLVLYLFTYTAYEAERLASFSRYMNTVALGYMLVVVIFILNPEDIHREDTVRASRIISTKKFNIAVMVVVLFLTGVELKDLFLLQARQAEKQESRLGNLDGLDGLFDEKTDRIYYISQRSNGYDYWQARYALTPVSINSGLVGRWSWSLAGSKNDDIWTSVRTVQEWSDELMANYTYVYIDNINEQFCTDYGELFADPENILEKTIYRVDTDRRDGLVTLVPFWF